MEGIWHVFFQIFVMLMFILMRLCTLRGKKRTVGTSFRTRILESWTATFSPVGTSFRMGRKFKRGAREMWLFAGGDHLITHENAKHNKTCKYRNARCKMKKITMQNERSSSVTTRGPPEIPWVHQFQPGQKYEIDPLLPVVLEVQTRSSYIYTRNSIVASIFAPDSTFDKFPQFWGHGLKMVF